MLPFVFFIAILALPGWAYALTLDEVLVVANKKAARSVGLARYYMQKRAIPDGNLVQIWVTDKERCSRQEYDKKIAAPIRRAVTRRTGGNQIRCLLLMYGVPLKVAGPEITEADRKLLHKLQTRKARLTKDLARIEGQQQEATQDKLRVLRKKIRQEQHKLNRSSSVDSELALVLAKDYSLSWWQQNPFFIGYQNQEHDLPIAKKHVLMVARLDGPDSETVKRLIKDSLEAEAKGLTGTAYFDARWSKPEEAKKSGYAMYDQSIHKAAERIKEHGGLEVVVDDQSRLFQPGECPRAALYCGWYKLAHYVDAFEWQKGAVGYHIASSECQSLKRGQYWCKRMVEDGVAATLGPVGEPYVQAFPLPEVFFSFLVDGYYTLAEAYLLANPFWSWKMVLVGDPLYRPFGPD